MKYISIGAVMTEGTEHILDVCRGSRSYHLTGELASVWLNGRFGFAAVKKPTEEQALLLLLRMGLAIQTDGSGFEEYRALTQCTLVPADRKHPYWGLTGMAITSALSRKDDAKKDGSKNNTENDTSDASKEDDGKLHSLEGTVKIEDLIPVTAASNIKIYVKAVSAQGYTFTYDLFDGTVNQDITDFETTADISGGEYTVTDPAGSKYEP